MSLRVVVTGAGGFAGRWLCRGLLERGVNVVGWVRRPPKEPIAGLEYRIVDVRNERQCWDGMSVDQPQQVFHLAAMTNLSDCEGDPTGAHNTNVMGTRNVFSSMPKSAVGVLSSTCHVYGVPQCLPITERHPLASVGVYSCSKQEAETEALKTGRKVVIARAFHHTGPGQSIRYAIADWCQQIRLGATTLEVGNIAVRRDYTDVRDVVKGYQVLADCGLDGDIYNLCSGVAHPMSIFIQWAANGRTVDTHTAPSRVRDGDVGEFRGDPSKAEAIGWIRAHHLRDTLVQMAE
jgi:GDP-4-dehydro-6-deoxy-D-mannose reductase